MPAFHVAAFGAARETRAVVNIGGIANVTLMSSDGSVIGFDTGPGNCLLDAWARAHLGQVHSMPAVRGLPAVRWMRNCWRACWPNRTLRASRRRAPAARPSAMPGCSSRWPAANCRPQDVQATLAELTALTIARRCAGRAATGRNLYVCGGGAFNVGSAAAAGAGAAADPGRTTAGRGIAPEHVEAAGFAWLAHRYLAGRPGQSAVGDGRAS